MNDKMTSDSMNRTSSCHPLPRPTSSTNRRLHDIQKRMRRFSATLSQIWAWLFLVILIVIFSLTGQGFFNLFNFQSIGANVAILLIMAMGQTFVIISGGIDLSSGFIMGLASVVGAMAMTSLPPDTPLIIVALVGLVTALVAGLIPGYINGVLIARLRVPPFIVTLGMFGIARGMGFIFSGGMPIPASIQGLGRIGNGYLAYLFPGRGLTWLTQLLDWSALNCVN